MPTFPYSRLLLLAWLSAMFSSALADDGDDVSAFNNVTLNAPPVPNPPPPNAFDLKLESNAQGVAGLSIPQAGSFLGFSIEMSVVNQVGKQRLKFIQSLLYLRLISWQQSVSLLARPS